MTSYEEAVSFIKSLSDDHLYTTAIEHCLQLFDVGLVQRPFNVVEIGSFLGVSTLALAKLHDFFPVRVTSVDLCDEIPSSQRQEYWKKHGAEIDSVDMSSMDWLKQQKDDSIDYIFHDAMHGDRAVPEYYEAWRCISPNGVLAIHDLNDLSDFNNFVFQLTEKREYCVSADLSGRMLGFFFKS